MQDNRISGVLIFALLTAVVHPVSGLASELGFKGNLLDRPGGGREFAAGGGI